MVDIHKTIWIDSLQEYPEIPFDITSVQDLPSWTYMSTEAPPLVELRTRYGLADVISGMEELPAALKLLEWVYAAIKHDGSTMNPYPCNALNILDVCIREKRAVNCRMKAVVLNEVYLSLGYRSRYITCMPAVDDHDCHVLVMVYITSLGRWITVDPTFNTYFTGSDGAIISVLEARQIYRNGGVPGLHRIEKPFTPFFWEDIKCESYDEFYLLYMSKNCFRFACPVASEFNYESHQDARFIYLSPAGYDSTGSEYDHDRELCFNIHNGSPFLMPPC